MDNSASRRCMKLRELHFFGNGAWRRVTWSDFEQCTACMVPSAVVVQIAGTSPKIVDSFSRRTRLAKDERSNLQSEINKHDRLISFPSFILAVSGSRFGVLQLTIRHRCTARQRSLFFFLFLFCIYASAILLLIASPMIQSPEMIALAKAISRLVGWS
jgi:hypothetical protein